MAGTIPTCPTSNLQMNPSVIYVYDSSEATFKVWDADLSVTGLQVTVNPPIPVSTDSTMSYFRATGLSNSATTIKATNGNLYGWKGVSTNSTNTYVKFYEMPAENVNPGTSTPKSMIMVPPNGIYVQDNIGNCSQLYFSGLSVLATSTISDAGTQVPPTGNFVYFECQYK